MRLIGAQGAPAGIAGGRTSEGRAEEENDHDTAEGATEGQTRDLEELLDRLLVLLALVLQIAARRLGL
ncbi:MAG: hypothetical protein KGR26_00115, partial [Cyanobacteria bacterium REEB65]|nr:hypothetical protein [Cyanobacteria bacterium REEB65]